MSWTRLRYHLVTATEGRRCYIDGTIESTLYEAMVERAPDLEGRVLEIGGIEDHVHLVVAIRPSTAVGTFVGQLKAHASRVVSRIHGTRFGWQSGYGAFTLWPEQMEAIREYVRHQKRHHRHGTIRAPLERIEPSDG